MRIGFIGVGNLASSIISGLGGGNFSSVQLALYDRVEEKAAKIRADNAVLCKSEPEVVGLSDYIFLTVKPADFDTVLRNIRNSGTDCSGKVFVSTAAAVSSEYISDGLGAAAVVRTMPNLPIAFGKGATAVSRGPGVTDAQLSVVVDIFSASGVCRVIDENMMNAVIAVNGSSPAYIFMLAQAMTDWAMEKGFDAETAELLTAQTISGSAEMLLRSGKKASELLDAVCSPGGTTVESVASLDSDGFGQVIRSAMDACTAKAEKTAR